MISGKPIQPGTDAARYVQEWGEMGAVWFAEGRSWEEDWRLHAARLEALLAELNAERERLIAELKGRCGARDMLSAAQFFEKRNDRPTAKPVKWWTILEPFADGTKTTIQPTR